MTASERNLALAVISLAESAMMPDTFWQTDSRVKLARDCLGRAKDDRHSRKHEQLLEAYDMARSTW